MAGRVVRKAFGSGDQREGGGVVYETNNPLHQRDYPPLYTATETREPILGDISPSEQPTPALPPSLAYQGLHQIETVVLYRKVGGRPGYATCARCIRLSLKVDQPHGLTLLITEKGILGESGGRPACLLGENRRLKQTKPLCVCHIQEGPRKSDVWKGLMWFGVRPGMRPPAPHLTVF